MWCPNRPFVCWKPTPTLRGAQLSDHSVTAGWTEQKNTARETVLERLCVRALCFYLHVSTYTTCVPGAQGDHKRVWRVGVLSKSRDDFDGFGSWASHCLTWLLACLSIPPFQGTFWALVSLSVKWADEKVRQGQSATHNTAHSLTLRFPGKLLLTLQISPLLPTPSDYRKMKNTDISCV